MSKIIKASHLVLLKNEKKHQDTTTDYSLSLGQKESIYQETRIMVEQLIDEAKVNATGIITLAKKEAEDIVHEAQIKANKEAKEILKKAYQEVEKIKENAYLDGKEAGIREANNLLKQAEKLVKQASQEKEQILKSIESDIIDLAVKISEKIIKRELTLNPQTIEYITKSLLEMVQNSKQIVLKVNAHDYSTLSNCSQKLMTVISQGQLKIEIDNSLEIGDCLIISEAGIIVAKIDAQLEKVRRVLRDVNTNV